MMHYDLSRNERFFINQLIPKWETGHSFDLNRDLKYIFHREMGTNYNPDVYEKTLETIRAFISDHGFAREDPAKQYTFSLLSKGNMLASIGSIEDFEEHMKRERHGGRAMVIPDHIKGRAQPFVSDQYDSTQQPRSSGRLLKFILVISVLVIIAMIIVRLIGNNE